LADADRRTTGGVGIQFVRSTLPSESTRMEVRTEDL
jgi:hypothetical protein